MHVFKRFYLLSILVASFCIPLITFTSYVSVAPMQELALLDQNLMVNTADDINLPINYLPIILWAVYGFGILLFALKFAFNMSKILVKIHKNPHYKSTSFINVLLEDLAAPHTFFNYIFLDKYKFESKQIPQEVIIHEQAHAKQQHSLDVLFIELLQIVFWFNPLVYFIKHAIKLNHEFLADQAVLNRGINTSIYQKILLNFSSTNYHPQLTNAINYSFIKKRFTIMKTHTSKRTSWLRSLILLPLLAGLIYGFSEKVTLQKQHEPDLPVKEEASKEANLQTITIYESISLHINKKNEILINGENYSDLKSLAKDLKIYIKNISPEQLANTKVRFIFDDTVEMGFVTDVKIEVRKAGLSFIRNTRTTDFKIFPSSKIQNYQDKATPQQIAEYNKLAKHYNALPKENMIVKLKDVERLEYIYGLMSEAQKKSAESFPDFQPPPPPPPIHENIINKGSKELQLASKQFSEIAENYVNAVRNYYRTKENYDDLKLLYNKVMSIHKVYSKLAKNENVSMPPPPPPAPDPERAYKDQKSDIPPPSTPPNPLDHMISLAKKGATFYYEGDKISSDKAIDIVKTNTNINIQVLKHDSNNPIVKLSKKPITVEGKKLVQGKPSTQSKWKVSAIRNTKPIIFPKDADFYINDKKATYSEFEKLDRKSIKRTLFKKDENKVYITTH